MPLPLSSFGVGRSMFEVRRSLLDQFLAEVWGRPYKLGEWDCILFIAAWADRLSGSANSFSRKLKGGYASEAEGFRLFASKGLNVAVHVNLVHQGWLDVVPAVGFQVGDIVLTDLHHPGIWDGSKILAQPARASGLLSLHSSHALLALRWLGAPVL